MEEEVENRGMSKESKATAAVKVNDTLEKILYCQELFAEFSEESESESYMEELKQDKASEHSDSPSESIKITNSSDASATDKVDVLRGSDVDACESVVISFPGKVILGKDSNKTFQITEERIEKAVEDFNTSGQSSYVSVPIILEKECQSGDVLPQASGKHQPKVVIFKVDSMPREVFKSTDKTKGMISSELQIDQVIEKCIEELVKKVTDDIIEEIQYSASVKPKISRKCFGKTIQLSSQIKRQSDQLKDVIHQTMPMKDSKDSSDEIHCKSDTAEYGNIVEERNPILEPSEVIDCVSDELKMKQQKKTLKEIDILSSTVDEIGRMNELFKNEVTSMLSEMSIVRRSARYVHENLTILEDLPAPACTIIFQTADGTNKAIVNVYDFGVSLLSDLSRLVLKFKHLFIDFDAFRLKFIELSESFSVIPLEQHVDETRDAVLDSALVAAVKVYQVFFNSDNFEILHEHFYTEREILFSLVVEFDSYLNTLGERHGAN